MAGFLGGLGSVASGVGKGLELGEDLQSKQLQKQAQDALGRAFMGGDGGLGGLGGLNQGSGPQPPMPGQASQPMQQPQQQPANQNFGPMSQTPPQPAQGQGVSMPDPLMTQKISYIQQAAQQRGIDPQTALQVAKSEGLAGGVGDQGSSGGPYQLHMGGIAPGGNSVPGMGDDFRKATGLDPRDPKNWKQTVDFALDKAKTGGWSPFHGAARSGIGNQQGIGGAQPSQGQPQPQQNQGAQGGAQGPGHSQLMSMAQRIQKANPGIKPGVLWQALAQAAPMMNQEAQQALKEQTLDLKSQLQTQREQSDLVLHQMDDFLKGQTSQQNTQTRAGVQERGQDMQSADKQKALDVSKARLDMLKQWRDSTADIKAKAAVQQKLDQEQKNYVSLQRALTGAEASPTPDKAQVGQLKTDVDAATPKGPRNEDAPPPQPAASAPAAASAQPPQGLPPGAKEGDVVKSPSGQMFKVVNGKLAPVT